MLLLEAAFDDICPALLFPELHAEAVLLVGHVIDIIVAVVDDEVQFALRIQALGNHPFVLVLDTRRKVVGFDIGIVAVSALIEIRIRIGQTFRVAILRHREAASDAIVQFEIQQAMRRHHAQALDIRRLTRQEPPVLLHQRPESGVVLATDHAHVHESAIENLQHRRMGFVVGWAMLAVVVAPLVESR